MGQPKKIKPDKRHHKAKNTTATKRTKHIDIRAHFVHEHVDEETGQMEIVFVRSEENKSDIFTKNFQEKQ